MFRSWCNANARRSSEDEITHVLMDGGILSVPWSKVDEFNKVYIQSIRLGEKLFVVEQKPPDVYNFFVDIDYKDDQHCLEMEQIKTISIIIHDTVKSLFTSPVRCLVTTALPKKVSGDQTKTGVHLNFPGLVVNQVTAVTLMHHLVDALSKVYSGVNWSKVIDDAVYGNPHEGTKGSGFRVPWSHKKGKHIECDGKGCAKCQQSGRIVESEYLSVFVSDGYGPLTYVDQTITLEKLEMATVRVSSDTPVSLTVMPFPLLVPPSDTRVIKKTNKTTSTKEGSFTKTQTKNEVFPDLIPIMETFIRQFLPGQANSRVQGIFKFHSIFLIKTNSKYCENIGRDHGSNHVWFRIESNWSIVQKCFCTCDTLNGRKKGLCKDFTGRPHRLSPSIAKVLFPEKKLGKIKKCIF